MNVRPVHASGPLDPIYSCRKFFELIDSLKQNSVLHFHALNHDLLIERLRCTYLSSGGFADGFNTLGSPYYGRLEFDLEDNALGRRFSGLVRLPRFVDSFDARFNLYKLHGSIDQYLVFDTVQPPSVVEPTHMLREVSEGGRYRYEAIYARSTPAFLSGVELKKWQYRKTFYSKCVFGRFENNLECASVLIVFGYGFGNGGINDIIRSRFLTRPSSRIVVVDVARPPRLSAEFEGRYEFLEGGVEGFDLKRLLAWTVQP